MSYINTRIAVFDLLFLMSNQHSIDIIMPNFFKEKYRVSGLWNKKKDVCFVGIIFTSKILELCEVEICSKCLKVLH